MKQFFALLAITAFAVTFCLQGWSQHNSASPEYANVYVINHAYAFTPKDTIDITSSFVSDTSAIVLVKGVSDSIFFSIVNIRGELMCLGEVVHETGIQITNEIDAFSGTFVCNIGKVVNGNHFFVIHIADSLEDYGVDLYSVDVVLEEDVMLRFVSTLTQGRIVDH